MKTIFTALATHHHKSKTFTVKASPWVSCVELVRQWMAEGGPDIHPHDVSVKQVNLAGAVQLEELDPCTNEFLMTKTAFDMNKLKEAGKVKDSDLEHWAAIANPMLASIEWYVSDNEELIDRPKREPNQEPS